jgi:hypothetical protein
MKDAGDTVPWANKTDHRLMWRGRTTGRGTSSGWEIWRHGVRMRLVELTNKISGMVPVLLPPADVNEPLVVKEVDLGELNKMIDTGFVGTVQCDPPMCEKIREEYTMKEPTGTTSYKYLLDVSHF